MPLTSLQRSALEARIRGLADTAGAQPAISAIVEGYGPEILGYLAASAPDEHTAREIFQDWCLRVVDAFAEFEWRSSARTWAYALARSTRGAYRRAGHRRREDRLETEDERALGERVWTRTRPFEQTGVKVRFRELRGRLAEDERDLLILRVDRGLSWNDIARVLSFDGGEVASSNTLAQRFRRLVHKLRGMATEEGLLEGASSRA